MNEFGFVILCPDRDLGRLLTTVRAAKRFGASHYLCTVPNSVAKKELAEFAEICPVVKAKDTYTSLINTGLKKSKSEWNFIVIAGASFKPDFHKKYLRFLQSKKDILFPIVNSKCYFPEGTLNGILIHRDAIKEVGCIEDGDLYFAKLAWAYNAIGLKYTFKAVMGVRFY